ncbi:MAG: prolyl oligopeptidase family serine peptidase, partial [Acidobacteria bacterium]|nr:prolyl oligopeptidase family serine peptidase [Acidobacteriota bacterium]
PIVLAALSAGVLAAQVDGRTKAQLLRRPYTSTAMQTSEKEREYFVYLPQGYETEKGKLWPVILFLHGGGERGNGKSDLENTLKHGPIMEAWVRGRDLPFVLIGPQLYTLQRDANAARPPARPAGAAGPRPISRAMADEKPRFPAEGPPLGWWTVENDLLVMVDATLKEFRGDPDRVYITGLSYGGFGAWYMAGAHADRWAAAAPICGAADPKVIPLIAAANLPIWIIQGGKDTTVRPEWVTQSAIDLEKAGHPAVRFTVHEDMAHNVWTRAYEGWDLYYWMLSHRRKAASRSN